MSTSMSGRALAGAAAALLAAVGIGLGLHSVTSDLQGNPGSVRAAVGATETVPGLSGVRSRVAEDGTTVVVTLTGTADVLPLPPAFADVLPARVQISAEGSSRTSLQR